jgi:hypothetical protein
LPSVIYKLYNETYLVKYTRINRLQGAGYMTQMNDELQKEYSWPDHKGEEGLEDQR